MILTATLRKDNVFIATITGKQDVVNKFVKDTVKMYDLEKVHDNFYNRNDITLIVG